MTLTTEQIQDIYEAAVHVEAVGDDQDTGFELLCKLDDVGGTGATIRKLIDMLRAANRVARPDDKPFGYYSKETAAILERRGFAPISANPLVDHSIPLYTAPPAPAVVNGRTAEGWMAEALLQKNVAEALRKSFPAVSEGECYKFPGRWIDCTDALPQNGENIITLNNIGGVYGGYIFKRYENGGWDFVDAEEEFRVGDGITHWMPLPAAPEGGN